MGKLYRPGSRARIILAYLRTVEWVSTTEIETACGFGLSGHRTTIADTLRDLVRAGFVDRTEGRRPRTDSEPVGRGHLHRRPVAYWSLIRSSRMTLEDAQALISSGVAFGDVYTRVAEGDRLALKGWYCTNPSVPSNPLARSRREKVPVAAHAGYTGNTCKNCSSVRMIRAGSCETCLECGSSTGCV